MTPITNKEEEIFLNELDKKLWTSADKLRSNLDAAVYKHAVLGLIFLKYISDSFDERRQELEAHFRDAKHDYYLGDDEELIKEELEIRDYYKAKIRAKTSLTQTLSQRERAELPSPSGRGVGGEGKESEDISFLEKALKDPIERAAMCAISGKADEELDQLPSETLEQLAATAALFPDELVESELGFIPEGWVMSNLGEEIDFATGFAFKSKEFTNSGIRLARGDNVKEGYFHWGDKSRYWHAVTEDLERYVLQVGDVLLGMDGSKVGKNWVKVRDSDLPCILVQRVARLRGNGSVGSSYLEILVGSQKFKNYVELVKTGTSIPHISGKQIKEFKLARPYNNNEIFYRFEKLLGPSVSYIDKNVAESVYLSELRDSLLPKLLSGEIKLKEAKHSADVVKQEIL